jgi:hypothetical protein
MVLPYMHERRDKSEYPEYASFPGDTVHTGRSHAGSGLVTFQ